MIQYDSDNRILDLNFSDIYITEKWTKKYIYELKGIENQLCRCKYNILKAKWHEIIYWYSLLANRTIKDKSISIENFIDSIIKVVESYENIIKSDKSISTRTYSLFKELHTITTNEFVTECEEYFSEYNKGSMKLTELLEKVGEQLYSVLINSIFELHEISIRCELHETCEFSNKDDDYKEYVRFLVNNLYNLNSYSIVKLEKFIEIISVDTSKIDFIADFKYFDDSYVNPNIIKMLDIAKSKFKSIIITNPNNVLVNAFRDKFDNEIVKNNK